MRNDEFAIRRITSSLRPPRIAILLNKSDQDWVQTVLRSIEWTSQVWGGWYSCLVPTDGREISEPFWTVLQHFDPDYLYLYRKSWEDIRLARPEVYEEEFRRVLEQTGGRTPDEDSDRIRQDLDEQMRGLGFEDFDVTDELRSELNRKTNPFRSVAGDPVEGWISARTEPTFPLTPVVSLLHNVTHPASVKDYEVEGPGLVALMAHARVGKLWPELRSKITEAGWGAEVEHIGSGGLWSFFYSLFDEQSVEFFLQAPAGFSRLNCSLYRPTRPLPDEKVRIAVIGDSLDDFCLYFDLSRLRDHVYWVPPSLLSEASESGQSALRALSFHLNTDARLRRLNTVMMTTVTLTDDDIARSESSVRDLGPQQEGHNWTGRITRDVMSLLQPSYTLFETSHVQRPRLEQFQGGLSVALIDTPKPKTFARVPPHGHNWISEIEIEGYRLPLMPGLGNSTIEAPNYDDSLVRVSRGGFAYFCPHFGYFGGDLDSTLIRPRIRILEPQALFQRLFNRAGRRIALSDKGIYQHESTTKFDDLQRIAECFRDPHMRALFAKYLDKSKSKEGEGDYIPPRRYLDFTAISKTQGEDSEDSAELSRRTQEAIDDLVKRAILRRGLTLICELCRQASWYPLEVLGQRFNCIRCGTSQVITRDRWKEPWEPKWYYSLDEVFYQCCSNDVDVPILALQGLRERSKDSFMFLPAVDVIRAGATKPIMEIDFLCLLDGSFCIGEAKKGDRLEESASKEERALNRYADLCQQVRASKLVLATSSAEWNSRTAEKAHLICSRKDLELILLTGQDLMPA